jgi:hypothetical protein
MEEMQTCEACGMEFDWTGMEANGQEYCCEGCATGGECTCPQHHHQYRTDQSMPAADQIGVTGTR